MTTTDTQGETHDGPDDVRVVGVDEPRRRPAPRRSRPSRPPERGGWLTSALAAVAVAGVAGTVAFGVLWYGQHSRAAGEATARTTAERFAYELTNFDAKNVDSDFTAIQAIATGQFAQQAQQFFNGSIRQQLQAAQAATRGQIRYLYTQSYGGSSASFYALVDQTFANSRTKGPQTDQLRLVIDLRKVAGTWKVANLTELSGPNLGGAGGG